MKAFTNAPECYDYSYVSTIRALADGWRMIEVTDPERFNRFQIPRYGSGLFATVSVDSSEAEALGLPSSATLAEGEQATSLADYGIEMWAEDDEGAVRVEMGGEAYVVHAPTVIRSETWDPGLLALGGGRLAALLCDESFERLFEAGLLNEAGSCPQLEQRARVLLATVPGGATPGRVAKLVAVLAEHPQVQLETCADERTGTRYGEATCRAGRATKLGYRTNHYQVWAVWPKEQT